jgi:UDP-N-acetylmuramyl tripeptide synthase
MKKQLAILACKAASLVGRWLGKGSSMPGKVALKICPDILARLSLPENVVAVTGSNGKTTTVELLVAALEKNGKTVCWNKEGANQIEGVATMLLRYADLRGRVRCDMVVMESDEQYARHTFAFLKPSLFAVLNLYRDQMTRNGHPEYIYDRIAEAISPEMDLFLNADDPLTACLSSLGRNTTWFGVAEGVLEEEKGVYDDGKYCPCCGGEMEYAYRQFATFGNFACQHCDYERDKPDFEAVSYDEESGNFTVSGRAEATLHTGLKTPYSLYNMLAAFSLAVMLGVDPHGAAQALSSHRLKSGRAQRWNVDGKDIMLLTSKHENSVSYDRSLSLAAKRGGKVLVMVDAISRKYFTGETSWLWDINFNKLNVPEVEHIVLAGQYACDLAERFSFTDIPQEKISLMRDLDRLPELFDDRADQPLTVVTCFSDRDKFIRRLPAEAQREEIA